MYNLFRSTQKKVERENNKLPGENLCVDLSFYLAVLRKRFVKSGTCG